MVVWARQGKYAEFTIVDQRFVARKPASIPYPAYTNWKTARNRNLRIGYELMLTPMLQGLLAAQQHQAEILEQCATWIDHGKLKIYLSKIFPLEQASTAHQLLQAGSIVGKIVLVTSAE